MIKELKYNEPAEKLLNHIGKGAFLTVKNDKNINTMTIGWANIGVIWNKPIFTVAVRHSRYTYSILEDSNEFTVSIPINKNLEKELTFCGTESGRDIDKFQQCDLKLKKGRKVSTPIISNCDLHYECKIIYQQAMELGLLDRNIKSRYYKNNDYHVLYYGEIVDCYSLDE